jgi:hypothetical protein
MLAEEHLAVLIAAAKDKKEFRSLDETFVRKIVEEVLRRRPDLKGALEENGCNPKSAVFKDTMKETRAKLREAYGAFRTRTSGKRDTLLQEYQAAANEEEREGILSDLLDSHQSTKERHEEYPTLYEKLLASHVPTCVLDLGCGLNPLSYPFLGSKPSYIACDLEGEELRIVATFFAATKVKGETKALDLSRPETHAFLGTAKADTVFLFKVADTLERQERGVMGKVIDALQKNPHVRLVIVSFALQSLGGKRFRSGGKENWFSRSLDHKGLRWERLEIPGEEFYRVFPNDP